MKRLLCTAAVLALAAGGCRAAAHEGQLSIIATVYPLAWVAEQIAPDAQITSLAAHGQDPHDQELTPQERGLLEQADLVAYVGDVGFQPQVEDAVAQRDGIVSAAAVLGQGALLPLDDGQGTDPHFWFDAHLLAQVATALGEAAAAADASHAQDYRAAAERVRSQLDTAADETAALFDSCRHDTVVVGHEAYAYLLEPHGITQHGISGAGGHSEASPADIASLVSQIRDNDLEAVLTEPVEGRSDAEAVAGEAGVDLIEIYSLDIVSDEQAAKGFPQLLREQAQAAATAAGCGP
jgi:zinc transport system substrate-binding protein